MSVSRRSFLRSASVAGLAGSVAKGKGWALPVLSGQSRGETPVASSPAAPDPSRRTQHKLQPVPIGSVVIDDTFWAPKRRVWQEVTIRDCFQKFETDRGGAINNFDKVRKGKGGSHAGDPWMDGLIYEMIRGASDFLIAHPDPELERQLDGYIERITAAAATNPSGYLNTYTQLVEPGHEWGLNGGLQLWQHEIYNLGALIDAGIHYYRATGKTQLLAAGVKIANYMYDFMGPAPKKNLVPCHPLPEEALVRLYELFEEQPELKAKIPLPVEPQHYLALAEFWIEDRGNNIGKPDWEKDQRAAEQFVRRQEYGTGRPSWGVYAQDNVPVFEQKEIAGHAVRATLLCAGVAAAARANNDPRYADASLRLWDNMVEKRMHITGGVGAFAQQEKFGPDYTLPNDAYLETCAAVGAGFFHHNMNMAFGHARYVDELERTLYNGALSGVSLKGDTYTYQNPLEAERDRARWVWHECPCCPPMFLKFMGAMPGYVYATDAENIYVNLFVGSHATIPMQNGSVQIKQSTDYPWDGVVRIEIGKASGSAPGLMLRIPGWAHSERLTVNGRQVATDHRIRGYVRATDTLRKGDIVELTLPMPVEQVRANPLVRADAGKVAIMRGPMVYCLESTDNGSAVRTIAVRSSQLASAYNAEMLHGVVVVRGSALAHAPDAWEGTLYLPRDHSPAAHQVSLTAIPFYANGNRGPVEMTVWLPTEA